MFVDVRYRRWGKRLFDIFASVLLLIVLSPVLVVVAAMTLVVHGAPIFFTQERPGLGGKPFIIFKFRTMREMVDENGEPLPDNLRTTGLGSFLRSSSLDELPELINVLRGEMSLVGPRPLLMCYLPRYTPEQARRHDVRPGITGLAQVHGRNAIDWDEKFVHDLAYIEDISFVNDLKILALTVGQLLRPTEVNADDHTTMPEFWGTASHEVHEVR